VKKIDPLQLATAIKAGDTVQLARAITLVESTHKKHRALAIELLDQLMPYTGNSRRIGISGVPGVGKSTFIEHFGSYLLNKGGKLAVLAVDPSSTQTRGAILGDKTRMEQLATHPRAFIRPSASGSTLGGVSLRTRETILLCEAAGYDTIFVETVGVGQSETAVQQLTDFFLLLMLAGAGDDLQGIKKGIVELADALVITKADGKNIAAAKAAKNQYQMALHMLRPRVPEWQVPVSFCSAIEQQGFDEVMEIIDHFWQITAQSGWLQQQRQQQQLDWLHSEVKHRLISNFYKLPWVIQKLSEAEHEISSGGKSPAFWGNLLSEEALNKKGPLRE
jgi:LAO/AO transport system kinase